jgi:signal transduction histidine kinase
MTARGSAFRETATGVLAGAGGIVVVSAAIALLEQWFPASSLTSLYLFAIFPVAIAWGAWAASIIAVASFLTFDFFFTPPLHTFGISQRGTAVGLVASIATALLISELARRARERQLYSQEAALGRVAAVVARGADPQKVFAAVTEEVGRLLGVDRVTMARYETDGTVVETARWSAVDQPVESSQGLRLPRWAMATPTRQIDDGSGASVAAPITVHGRRWGVMIAVPGADRQPPLDAEERLQQFSELIATAIATAQDRAELSRLAEEQAALGRVATLVARGAQPDEVFSVVSNEVGRLFGSDQAAVARYEREGAGMVVVGVSQGIRGVSIGTRWPLEDFLASTAVYRTGRPARTEQDDYEAASGPVSETLREINAVSNVAAPIVVDDRVWGVMTVSNVYGRLPADAEERLAKFTELVATAVANVQAQTDLQRLAEEHAALRRVATMVARERPPEEVFAKVAEEVGLLLGVESASIDRYEPDAGCTVVASWGKLRNLFEVGSRWKLDRDSASARVHRTGRPVRLDDYEHAWGSVEAQARELGLKFSVASPIVVNGGLWGAIFAATTQTRPMPADAEARIGQFTELVATAIANVQARSDLATSSARIVTAADEERRRVVRDLHDGAQQRLVHTVMRLKLARRALDRDPQDAAELVTDALQHAQAATQELRELVHGILPSALRLGGLNPAIRALASRMPIPVEIDVSVDPLPWTVESTAYFFVAEALTNVAKHANAHQASVTVGLRNGMLHAEVRDDGVGGAQAAGSGIVGLRDRLVALGGALRIESPQAGGTRLNASIPLPLPASRGGQSPTDPPTS